MRSTFFGLQIGQAGLGTAQFGLDVTSHNIANTETAGFTRQRVVQTAIVPHTGFGRALPPVSQVRVGVGTRVLEHGQIRSEFLDRRFRTQNSLSSYWTTRSEEMSYLQSFFDSINEDTSINHTLNNFFEAVKLLSGDPVEGATRTLLRDAGLDLVQQFNTIFRGLIDLQERQNDQIEAKVGDINRIASEIVELNKSIHLHEITGHIANDLRDRRNLLVDDLSRIVDVEYRVFAGEDGFDRFELSVAGNVLVSHDESALLGVMNTPNVVPGQPSVVTPVWVKNIGDHFMPGGETLPPGADMAYFTEVRTVSGRPIWVRTDIIDGNLIPLNLDIVQGGQIKALVNMRDGRGTGGEVKGIPYYVEMMNHLARSIVQEFNAVHREGWSDHPVYGSQTGINFFFMDESIGFLRNAAGQRITLNENDEWVDAFGNVVAGIDPTDPSTFPPDFEFVVDISQITAENIRLSEDILQSASNIAASSVQVIRGNDGGTAPGLQQGNNNNMRALHELFALRRDFTLQVPDHTGEVQNIVIGSFDGFATAIRHDVGSTTSLALAAARNGHTLITSMFNQREAVAGVQLDEEMVSLIRYQHAYSGAARVITAMDDALDRLINGTGRVGL